MAEGGDVRAWVTDKEGVWGKLKCRGPQPKWERDFPESIAIAVAANAVVIASAEELTALDLKTGAVLWNERDNAMTQRYREIDRAAQALGVSVQPLAVREPDDSSARSRR